MKRLILLFLLYFQTAIGQTSPKVYFFFNDSELSFQDIQRKINFLIETSNIAKSSVEIIHFTERSELSSAWKIKKTQVKYSTTIRTCDFNLCSHISAILSVTKTNDSKVFFTDKKTVCNFDLQSFKLPNKDESTISEQLKVEFLKMKSSKSPQTIFFLFSGDSETQIPIIKFENEKLILKESEKIELRPEINGKILTHQWTPSINLSCSDCPNPILTASSSGSYTLTVKDSSECHTVSKTIEIELLKSCLCDKEIGRIEILFGKLPIQKYEIKNPSLQAEWDWRIISNQSGLYVFDLITNSICAKKFRLKVKTAYNEVIYDEIYLAEDVDKRSGNDLLKKFPNNLVFRVDLSDFQSIKKIEDVENNPFFIIEIIPFDDDDEECQSRKYVSPKLRPTKCH